MFSLTTSVIPQAVKNNPFYEAPLTTKEDVKDALDALLKLSLTPIRPISKNSNKNSQLLSINNKKSQSISLHSPPKKPTQTIQNTRFYNRTRNNNKQIIDYHSKPKILTSKQRNSNKRKQAEI